MRLSAIGKCTGGVLKELLAPLTSLRWGFFDANRNARAITQALEKSVGKIVPEALGIDLCDASSLTAN